MVGEARSRLRYRSERLRAIGYDRRPDKERKTKRKVKKPNKSLISRTPFRSNFRWKHK